MAAMAEKLKFRSALPDESKAVKDRSFQAF
jgi:hypothetical protein